MTSPVPSRQGSFTSPPPPASPRRPSGLGLGSNAEQRKARREQFRSFYGLKNETVEEQGLERGEGSSKTGDPLDLNSSAFDASAYYDDLIKKSSLAELMQTASTLLADINNLQSSRHSLVYNHHHQLFAAGDTISHLNSRTPQLISIMISLQDSFSSISQLADSVAMPERDTKSTVEDKEDALRLQLERTRLMFLAEEDAGKIRKAWSGVTAEGVVDEDLLRKVQEIQARVDDLPAEPAPVEETA